MRLYAQLIIALFVVYARTATIPNHALPELEKKLSEAAEEVLDKNGEQTEIVSSEQELIDPTNNVKDSDNNLRNRIKIIDNIPVKVIVEDKPYLKFEKEIINEVVPENDESDIKRPEIDLKNPGPPQHQEHETQNPEHHDHEDELQAVTTIKQTIQDTQNVFEQGLQGITQGIQGWFSNNEQLASIQENIQNLQLSFTNQITKLNDTIQGFWKTEIANSNEPSVEELHTKGTIKNVESGLKVLENNFETGVKSLATGVQILATLRSDTANSSNSTVAAPSGPFASIAQYLQGFQNTIVQGFTNVTNTIQNYVTQNQQVNANNSTGGIFQGFGIPFGPQSTTAADVQSDEATTRPTIWQGIQSSIQNILNPAQAQGSQPSQSNQQNVPNGPFAQAIQNNPFVQGVVNLIQPKPPANQKPTETAPVASTAAPSSDVKPADETKPQTSEEQQKQKPEQQASPGTQSGPIQQIIQRNPIVQGIAGAVQRIQGSIINPEKPRDADSDSEKGTHDRGHFHVGGHTGSGDNSDVNKRGVVLKSDQKTEKIVESVVEEIKKEVQADDEQKESQVVSDKTE